MKDNLTLSAPTNLAKEVDKLASQCVKCALCLPHCPTYTLTEDENESPRGRIALFQAIAQAKLPLTNKASQHLDRCLGCRACERVCPAHVEYGHLLTLGREYNHDLPSKTPLQQPKLATRLLSWLARKPRAMQTLHSTLWILQTLGLRRLGRVLKIPQLLGMRKLDAMLPQVTKPKAFAEQYLATAPKQGQIQLFIGCMTELADQQTLSASIQVLQRFGYDILLPKQQNCCGAIDLHAGEALKARRLATQNVQAFADDHPVLTLATGCSAVLQEYDVHFGLQPDSPFAAFSAKVFDVLSFLSQKPWPDALNLQPLPYSVILHTPCTRRNVLKAASTPEQILKKIPALQITLFSSWDCCGAAGTYMLEHPQIANTLADKLIAELQGKTVDFLVTTNIGCALHLQERLAIYNPRIKVVHPIILLAKALGLNSL